MNSIRTDAPSQPGASKSSSFPRVESAPRGFIPALLMMLAGALFACGTGGQASPLPAPAPAYTNDLPIAQGPYTPSMESLKQYACPDWFRDAKFGIWAHWGPQAVPMMGDWYAKHIYVPDNPQYKHHLETYGHPSTNGYKDIIPLWKAEKFDPDRLMALYKKAGAKYFVSMGTHHDNFFLWNSKLHRWNAANMGPHRDIVGAWQAAAQKLGLKFGVSEHLGASFTWFQPSHGADKSGPMAGVPYDGANPEYQDLYHFPAEPGDTAWYSNNPRWQRMWFDRIQELVDNYRPDLLYTDGGVPFGNQVGRNLIAHYYNRSANEHNGKPQVIYTCKEKSGGRWIEDLERGVMPGINPDPWQTDTSIGDWYYNRNWKFRPVSWTIQMLVDIVSKNGNLLLNVVQRPDGSIDPEVEAALQAMATWIAVNGEAVYGTRPWLIHGEGPVRAKGGHFKEDFAYSARDIRFTAKGGTLYAFALGWPEDRRLVIRALASIPGTASNRIDQIDLLGGPGKLGWTQDTNGLAIILPSQKPCEHAIALKITGSGLVPVIPPEVVPVIRAGADGSLKLDAETAEPHGSLHSETRGDQSNIGFWDSASDFLSWDKVQLTPGTYEVEALVATVHEGSGIAVELAASGSRVTATVPNTGAWEKFVPIKLGTFAVQKSGESQIICRPADPARWKAINLVQILLRKAQ